MYTDKVGTGFQSGRHGKARVLGTSRAMLPNTTTLPCVGHTKDAECKTGHETRRCRDFMTVHELKKAQIASLSLDNCPIVSKI